MFKNLLDIVFMVISTTIFYDDPLYKRLLVEINEIAVREDEKKLSKVLLLSLAGLCAGLKPCKIAEKVGWKSSSLRGELCNKLYKYIKILVGKQGEKANWKIIAQWLRHWLEQVQREINSLQLTLADISENPSVTAEQFINPAQKEVLDPIKIGFLPSDIANLEKEIDNADNFYTEEQYEQALHKYQSVIAKVFAHYPAECRFMEVLVKVVSCYDRIQAYRDLEELASFALAYDFVNFANKVSICQRRKR